MEKLINYFSRREENRCNILTNQSAVHSSQSAITLAMNIYHVIKKFPRDVIYLLITQL